MTARVLVIDDSALMRRLLVDILSSDPELEVVGTANDPVAAVAKIRELRPDVLTLDVEMPQMDGLTFLDKLMRSCPLPVVMVSSLTEANCHTTLRALELGAVDFVSKPKLDLSAGTFDMADEIVGKVKAAARARLRRSADRPARVAGPRPKESSLSQLKCTHRVLCIGASTGGTEALFDLLTSLPADAPGTLIVQHMPPGFTQAFAKRLDGACAMRIHEARDGDHLLPGHALLAPGGLHMEVERSGAEYRVRVANGELVNRHRPSVDVLFRSAAKHIGPNAIGVILTGMGNDGAAGLAAMHASGAPTVAQDEATCVVFGMPKEAIATGEVDRVLPLHQIAAHVLQLATRA